MKSLILTLLLILGAIETEAQTHYYAATNGVSGNTGTSTNSPKDLQSGLNLGGGNVILHLLSGTYSTAGGAEFVVNAHGGTSTSARFKIIADINGPAYITGNTNYGLDIFNSPYVWVENVHCFSNNIDGIKTQSPFTYIRNCQAWYNGTLFPGNQNWDGSGFTSNSSGCYSNTWENCLGVGNGNGGGHGHNWYYSHFGNLLINCGAIGANGGYGFHCYSAVTTAHNYANRIVNSFSYGNNSMYGGVFYGGDEVGGLDAGTNYAQNCLFLDGLALSWGQFNMTNIGVWASPSDPTRPVNTNSARAPIFIGDYIVSPVALAGTVTHATIVTTPINQLWPNLAKGQFWLSAINPLRGIANPSVFYSTDFFGNSQSSVTDIGPFQYSPAQDADTRNLLTFPAPPPYWTQLTLPPISSAVCCER